MKDKIKARLKERGAYQFWPVQMGMGKRTLDCLGCYFGRFFAVEAKAPGEDLTELQKHTRGEIHNAGGPVFRVNSDAELAELVAWMDNVERVYTQILEDHARS